MGGARGGGNPDIRGLGFPPTLSLPHKGGGDAVVRSVSSAKVSAAGDRPTRSGYLNSTFRISKLRALLGVVTSAFSPLALPIRARAMGELMEILPALRSASSSPTILYFTFSPE